MLPIGWRDYDTSELLDLRPSTTTEADEYRAEIIERIARIDLQLKDPERKGLDGQVMSSDAYFRWRGKAVGAQSFMRSRLTALKGERNELNTQERDERKTEDRDSPAVKQALGLLAHIARDLKRIADNLELEVVKE